MAMTAAEKKRAQRQREEAERRKALDGTYPYLKRSFSDLANDTAGFTDFEMPLELAGIEPPTFFDESDAIDKILNADAIGIHLDNNAEFYRNYKGAMGRAELTIDCLLDAAIELAAIVNQHKQSEIKARLLELESSDTTDKARDLNEAVKLNKILDQLNKGVRRNLPQWKVTGI